MTQVSSNAHTVQIVAAGGSALAVAANAMSVGTWAQLSTLGITEIGTIGSEGGTSASMFPFVNKMVWDPIDSRIVAMGSDHHGGLPQFGTHECQYLESTNTWTTLDFDATSGTHGYDHLAVRPDTGDLYYRGLGNFTNEPAIRKLRGGAWGTFAASPSTYSQIGVGSCWWSGALSGAGAAGAWIIWESSFGDFNIFDPIANNWSLSLASTSAVVGGYQSAGAYSAVKNVAVFGGESNGPRKMFRLNANRTVTALPDAPINVGVQRGNLNVDPVSGNFLIWGGGSRSFYELDPATGVYTQLTGSRLPPAAGANGVSDPATGQSIMSVAIPKYGVVAYISASPSWAPNVFLYKHA